MFRRFVQVSSIRGARHVLRSMTRNNVQKSETTPLAKEKWDLCAGVLVERLPIISKSLNPLETEFQQLLWQIEFESSLKSDHELKHERDLVQAERIKKGEAEIDLDESSSKLTAQDLKDQYVEEFKKFILAKRVTETDGNPDLKSTNRKLEDNLYLLIEQKLGEKVHLVLPQGPRQEGETMRQAAERIFIEKCGESIQVQFYGNSPCGFYKYKYPSNQRKDSVGAKIFFFRSSLKAGNVDSKVVKKFEWHNKESLQKTLKGSYAESVEKFLF